MFDLQTIVRLNKEQGKRAKKQGKQPYIALRSFDKGVSGMPNFGNYRPKGWKLINTLFVDKSGFGSENEPALTFNQFVKQVQKGLGYAIIEEGQFQVYIGVFEKK